ncbi:MAG: VOC family protein [Alphaproteobacteria bacterium]|nr:VOC family protein [Alphaproteobacteria bacterium]
MSLAFERVTVFCRDLDASLAFYRDILGLVPVEEKTIEGPAAGGLLQLPPCRMRIALLAPSAEAHASIGLFEISGTPMAALPIPEGPPAHGQTAVVLATTEFDAVAARLAAAGVRTLTPPLRYPKRQASARSPAGLYRETIVFDPDGILVSLMQIDPLPEGDAA